MNQASLTMSFSGPSWKCQRRVALSKAMAKRYRLAGWRRTTQTASEKSPTARKAALHIKGSW